MRMQQRKGILFDNSTPPAHISRGGAIESLYGVQTIFGFKTKMAESLKETIFDYFFPPIFSYFQKKLISFALLFVKTTEKAA